MKATIRPSRLKGTINAPASKSSMQRACAAALLRTGETIIYNPGHANDDKAALAIIRALGASTEKINGEWHISSNGVKPTIEEIDCGESGLAMRMFTPIVALSGKRISITGSGSLGSRPMGFFDDVLPRLGVVIETKEGHLPLTIQGPLVPADIRIDGSVSSQFLTGLLMAYAAANAKNVSIKVDGLKSKPYIDLTLSVMQSFGMAVPENRDYREFYFAGTATNPQEKAIEYTVENDWSGGACLLVAGAIAGPLTVHGLDPGSTQADRSILDALMAANAGIAMEAKGIKIHPGEMDAFYFDATDCPDLFPPLVALATYCNGETTIKGVSRLTHKESNRAVALQDEFDKMGVVIELRDDTMVIKGVETIRGADIDSHHDHRIAMACAIAALRGSDETIIDGAEAVNKSYPGFFTDLEKLGADVSLDNTIRLHE